MHLTLDHRSQDCNPSLFCYIKIVQWVPLFYEVFLRGSYSDYLLWTSYLLFSLRVIHRLSVLTKIQVQGVILCAGFTVPIKNCRGMINNTLAGCPVIWVISAQSAEQRKKQLCIPGGAKQRQTGGAVFFWGSPSPDADWRSALFVLCFLGEINLPEISTYISH